MAALANLLSARRHMYNLKLSRFYAEEAARLYRDWGAHYVAHKIENAFNIVKIKPQTTDGKHLITSCRCLNIWQW